MRLDEIGKPDQNYQPQGTRLSSVVAEPAQKRILFLKDKGMSIEVPEGMLMQDINKIVLRDVYAKQAFPKIPFWGRKGFIQDMTLSALGGVEEGISSINKALGLGAFKATREMFVESGEKLSGAAKTLSKDDNPIRQFASDFSSSLGAMSVTLPIYGLAGSATKSILLNNLVPSASKVLARIPDFAIGMGEAAFSEKAQEGKPFQAVVKGAEETAIGTLYGSIGFGKTAMDVLKTIPKMTALGYAQSHYDALKENRLATLDEQVKGAANGLAMGTIFAAMPFLERITTIDGDIVAIKKLKDALVRANKEGDVTVANRAVDEFTGKKDVSTIDSAALEINGKIYKGASHIDALDNAVKDGAISKEDALKFDLESKGLFIVSDRSDPVTREEAFQEFGIKHTSDIEKLISEIPEIKNTETAMAYGKSIASDESKIFALRQARDAILKEIRKHDPETLTDEQFNEDFKKITQAQLYREAIEEAQKKQKDTRYKRPVNHPLPKDQIDLSEVGQKTSIVQDKPLGKVGDIITFGHSMQRYIITKVEKIPERWMTSYSRANNPRLMEASSQYGVGEEIKDVVGGIVDQTNFENGVRREGAEKDPAKISKKIEEFIDGARYKMKEAASTKETARGLEDDFTGLRTTNARIEIEARQLAEQIGYSQEDIQNIDRYIDHFETFGKEPENIVLTPDQRALYEQVMKPLGKERAQIMNNLRKNNIPVDDSVHNRRFVIGRGSIFDRFKLGQESGFGGALKTTTGGMKSRVWKALVDDTGNRVVVAIKKGMVTAFKNKKSQEMGPLKKKMPSPVEEYFDKPVMQKLVNLANKLGIDYKRVLRDKHLTGGVLGYSVIGSPVIRVRPATPESVILHEIGHQIDQKYGLQEIMIPKTKSDAIYEKMIEKANKEGNTKKVKELKEMQNITKELQALADLRYEGQEVSEYFKNYVRKGSEKIAVMFEAWLQSPEKFKATAPKTYKKFVEFLESKEDLKSILDIKSTLVLGGQTTGEVQEPKEFIDKNDKHWKIKDATQDEIEANTDEKYFKDAFLKSLVDYVQLQRAQNALDFMEGFKNSPDFKGVAVKGGAQTPPEGWRPTSMMNFAGYYFEPRVADALDFFNKRMYGRDGWGFLTTINNLLRTAIFFNPMIHVPNIGIHWEVNRGVSKWFSPREYSALWKTGTRAADAVTHLNEDYLAMLDSGVNLLYHKYAGQTLQDIMKAKMGIELRKDKGLLENIAKDIGASPLNLIKNIYDFSGKITWWTNDVAIMQAIYEEMGNGKTRQEAIDSVSKHIPNYVVPSRILDSRELSEIMTNQNISMFGAYHYGMLKSYGEMAKSLVKPLAAGERKEALDKIGALILTSLVLYPMMDKLMQALTGDKSARVGRAGAATVPDLLARAKKGRIDYAQALQAIVTPAILLRGAVEFGFNINTLAKKRYDEGQSFPEMMGRLAVSSISPISLAERQAKDWQGWGDLLKDVGLGMARVKLGFKEEKAQMFKMMDNKQSYQKRVDKAFAKNPEQAKQMVEDFNMDQMKQLADLANSVGVKGVPDQSVLNKFLVKEPGKSFARPPLKAEDLFKKVRYQKTQRKSLSAESVELYRGMFREG